MGNSTEGGLSLRCALIRMGALMVTLQKWEAGKVPANGTAQLRAYKFAQKKRKKNGTNDI